MNNIYLLTFYTEGESIDGGYDLTEINRQIKERLSPYFTEIFSFNKRELKKLENSENVCNYYEEQLSMNPNANCIGYFDFKGFLIRNILNKIPEGSILIYHDSNFEKNKQYWESDWQNVKSISEKLLSDNYSDVFFQIEHDNAFVKEYVKTYTIDKIIKNPEENVIVKECFLINAARFILRNTPFSRKFIEEYLELCMDKTLIARTPNDKPHPEFKWSCGDQDVLNCLVYKYILEGKLHAAFPMYSFIYRVLRFENRPFMWFNKPHPTGISRLNNIKLISYLNSKGM